MARANPALLEALAQATGGTFFADPEDAPSLAELSTTRRRSLGVRQNAPLSTWWAFALVVAAFVVEWMLRRRWGRR